MLARLEEIDGVALAEVDHRGELLRLRLTSEDALAGAVATLREMGYGADELSGAAAAERWYGRDTVRELSREEGEVIARRVVSAFARARGIASSISGDLVDLVARALYACFAAHTLGARAEAGALRRACASAVEAAVRDRLGPDRARELAALLSADLGRSSGETDEGDEGIGAGPMDRNGSPARDIRTKLRSDRRR